ncbi:hypothetical protein JOM56_002677 [Amanita muscaria]
MLQSLLSLVGWTIIPDVATNQVLKLFHSFSSNKLKKPPPPPGSPAYRKHYAYAFSFVVLSYLTYNLIQSARDMPPNFYHILGVPPNVDDTGLKSAFRQFAKRYHPDRPHVGRAGEELFIFVRDAYDALKNPTVRFAYDRFGPAVLRWNDCTTPGEYIRRGLLQAVGYHVIVGAALVFWSMIGHPSPVSFWRYILYATLFLTELVLVLTPSAYSLSRSSPVGLPGGASTVGGSFIFNTNLPNLQTTISPFNIFHTLLPSQVAYQHVQFLHQVFIFLSIALSRVAPQLFPQQDPRLEVVLLDRINVLLAHADREASIALHTQLQTVSSDNNDNSETEKKPAESVASHVSFSKMRPLERLPPSLINTLVAEMENIIIEGNIRKADIGFLRAAWESALERRSGAEVKDEEEEEAPQL